MIEAIIVAAALVTLFAALVYVHRVYGDQARIMRAASASALGYATQGCKGSVRPADFLAPDDAQSLSSDPTTSSPSGGDPTTSLPASANSQSQSALSSVTRFGLPKQTFVAGQQDVSGPFGAPNTALVSASELVFCNDVEHTSDPIGLFQELEQFFF